MLHFDDKPLPEWRDQRAFVRRRRRARRGWSALILLAAGIAAAVAFDAGWW